MKSLILSKQEANAIYDILVRFGGAIESMRHCFVYHHTNEEEMKWQGSSSEYRFGGKLGWGAKFRMRRDRFYIDCYKEDETDETRRMMEMCNEELEIFFAKIRGNVSH